MYGLNFVPTPNWTKEVEFNERLNLARHVRRIEWEYILPREENSFENEMPPKLKIPKFNRPDKDLLSQQVNAYCESVSAKLRLVKPMVKEMFYSKNNLNENEQLALNDLRMLVRDEKIVVCRADKDGKVLVVNYEDYNQIMKNELERSFTYISSLTTDNKRKHLNNIRNKADNQMIELHKIGIIDDQMLKHATGIEYYECKGYQKIPGPVAKIFSSNRPGYAYPLFKTHKLTPDALSNVSVFDIPIRLLQSAGNITTSKITAFLEHIFQPISIKFCQFKINEYCRDSKQYLHEVAEWKTTVDNNSNNDNLYIVAGDVKALYPTISRSLVEKALTYVLNHFSHYSKAAVKILVDLAPFCLNNVVIQYKEGFFTQSIGIVTGDNHYVSLANITLHYVILPVSDIINQAVLFKRYIDDIIWRRQYYKNQRSSFSYI